MVRAILLIDDSDTEVLVNTDRLRYARFTSKPDPGDSLILYFDKEDSLVVQTGKESDRVWKLLKESLPQWARATSRSRDKN